MRAQIHQPLPEVVLLHEFVEDRGGDDEGIFWQMHVLQQPVLFQNMVREREPLRLSPDTPVADQPAALFIKWGRVETPIEISVIHSVPPNRFHLIP
ncbi:hypothetical protein SDC9_102942 [bioreactor metagenome]|uniref:Uncharacterized protein n=1 Tax=bioreactor metagenome TaxID=1076179 RepID=A0A645AS89_9ZZZZ